MKMFRNENICRVVLQPWFSKPTQYQLESPPKPPTPLNSPPPRPLYVLGAPVQSSALPTLCKIPECNRRRKLGEIWFTSLNLGDFARAPIFVHLVENHNELDPYKHYIIPCRSKYILFNIRPFF